MARRTRSFLFDNISKRLVQNTNKTAKEINNRRTANTTANTDILTKAEVETVVSNTGINTLSDISIANVANEQVLQYNANTAKWENETLSLVSSVDGLTDTNISSVQRNDYLQYDGTNWINSALDLSSYVTDTEIADYSNTAQMNTAIAASNTAMKSYVDAEVAGVVNSAPAALDTLNELAAALGDDANFATTTSTALGNRLRIDVSNQGLNSTQLSNARTNLGLGTAATTASTDYATSAQGTKADTAHGWGNHALAGYGTSNFSGAYADLTGKPTIPTNNNQLTNGAGYITTTSANNSLVQLGAIQLYNNEKTTYTAAQGLLIYDQAGDNCLNIYNSNLSRWVKIWDDSNDGASSGLDADLLDGQHGSYYSNYNNLSNKPTIPTNNNQLTNGAGYITSTVSGDLDIVGDVKAAGMLRGTGWWNTNSSDRSGYAVEIGWSGGQGYLLAYSRTNSAYGSMNFTATDFEFHTGAVSVPSLSSTGTLSWSGGHSLRQGNVANNIDIRSNTTGAAGIVLKDSGGSFKAQMYGEGTNYGFLTGEWGSWDIKKTNNGDMTLRVSGTNRTVYHTGNLPTIPTNNNQLTNGAGYITNSGGTEAATASTVAKRNSSGDINARLFRSNYSNQSTISGAIAYRVNTSDNYIRFCSDGAAIRSFIGAGTSNFNGAYSSLSGLPTLGGGTPYLDLSTANYGTVKVDDDRGVSWAGYTIRDDWSLMSNGATYFGVYNDTDNNWAIRCTRGGTTDLRHNGTVRLSTDGSGVAISGRVAASGDSTFYQSTHGPYAGHTSSGNVTSLEIVNTNGTGDGNVAAMSFHCGNYYGMHMHLRHDSYFGIGGWSASTWRWYVQGTTGNMTAAGNVTAYSDPRLKENITPLTGAIDKIKKLNGMEFTWKDLPDVVGTPGARDYGVLSTEVAEVAPHAIHESPHTAPEGDTYKTVAYDKLIPLLIEAVKEQQKEIDELKAKLA